MIVGAERFGDIDDRATHDLFELRRHAKMHGDGTLLVLEQCSRMRLNQRFYRSAGAIELSVHEAGTLNGAAGFAPLDTVQSRRGQFQRRKQFVQCFNFPPAHQGDGAAQTFCDFSQERFYFRVRGGLRRCVGQLDQRSVDIQEQTPVEFGRRWCLCHVAKT